MSRMTSRLARLERAAARRAVCEACGGAGRPAAVWEFAGAAARSSGGCHACGAISATRRVRVLWEDQDAQRTDQAGAA